MVENETEGGGGGADCPAAGGGDDRPPGVEVVEEVPVVGKRLSIYFATVDETSAR